MDIINCLLFIIIIQDKSLFRFDGNFDSDVTRIQKRKLAENKAMVLYILYILVGVDSLSSNLESLTG